MDKQKMDQWLDEHREVFADMSRQIWSYAEMRFCEVKSAALQADFLEQEGFMLKRGVAGLPTAFSASFGSGKPIIAFLGEYDALAGLSQTAGAVEKKPLSVGGSGHGCGHNLLGTGALAAAVAVKRFMEENKLNGTIRYYGCPGEEGGSGKTFMAREGVFSDLDAAFTWHPFSYNAVMSVGTLANFQVNYRFHGRSAHAAAAPHLGRSALDAVELMNVGVNYLREHMIPEARVHYAVINAGGVSPNVVQAEAESLYLIRAPKLEQVRELYERVCKIAQGAALMTETECEIVFDKACSNYIPNKILDQLLYANFQAVGAPVFDEEDRRLAEGISGTLSATDVENDVKMANNLMCGRGGDALKHMKGLTLADAILPYEYFSMTMPGSTDVGDVSWVVPTSWLSVACQTIGTPGHSWQETAQSATDLAHKGMITAAKVLARTAVDLLADTALTGAALAELRETLDGTPYINPIPPDVQAKPYE